MNIQAAIAIKPDRHGFDGEPPELIAPRDFDGEDKRDLPERENANSDRLLWLYRHDKIDRAQYYAGLKLQRDRQLSQIGGFVACTDTGVRVAVVSSAISDTKADAVDRVNAAKAALTPTAWRLIEMVALENIQPAVAAKRLWGRFRKGEPLDALRYALDQLAAHYGLALKNRLTR